MTGPGCGWSKISRVRAPYDNLDPAVKPLQSPESAVYIIDSLLGGCPRINPNSSNDLRISPPGTKCGIPRKTKNRSAAARRKSLSTFTCFSDRLLGRLGACPEGRNQGLH